MSNGELCFLTLAEQSRLIASRQISPVELLESVFRQIDRIDGKINAYITVTRDAAMAEAREAESEIGHGEYRGQLHGIPIALKDLLYTKGVRTTAGSKILSGFVPTEDATVVARLRHAGAVGVGKTNMNEFAYGANGINPHYGDVHNPWDPARITGGSSSGSAAAVAAFMCSAALGSDTGGSIRNPAALCGVVGLKPTYGRVSRYGAVPCAWSLDNVGPLARTAEDAAIIMAEIAGWDPEDPASSSEPVPDYVAALSKDISGLRIAVLQEYATDPLEPDVSAAFNAALDVLRNQGATVELLSVPEVAAAIGASTAILSSEVTAYHEENLRTKPEDFGPEVRDRLETGLLIAATDYIKGQRVRRVLIQLFMRILRRYDAIVCPTVPAVAPKLEQETVQFEGFSEPRGSTMVRHTRLFNLNSLPAVSVPCGFASNGMPVGLQVATAPFTEETTLLIAHAYQRATDWHRRTPAIAGRLR
jgi:aspartyl-tRNA(Asn)/glutamyl-tRNA(Gln) amidotransferase subunit A